MHGNKTERTVGVYTMSAQVQWYHEEIWMQLDQGLVSVIYLQNVMAGEWECKHTDVYVFIRTYIHAQLHTYIGDILSIHTGIQPNTEARGGGSPHWMSKCGGQTKVHEQTYHVRAICQSPSPLQTHKHLVTESAINNLPNSIHSRQIRQEIPHRYQCAESANN